MEVVHYSLVEVLLEAIRDCGTIMSVSELLGLLYGPYGYTEYVEDADGNVVEEKRTFNKWSCQEIANIYTDGFDCMKF